MLRREFHFLSRVPQQNKTHEDDQRFRHLLSVGSAMQKTPVKLLDVVALFVDKPDDGLVVGQVGIVVEVLGPDLYEIEFLDSKGKTIAMTELKRPEVLLLKHELAVAA